MGRLVFGLALCLLLMGVDCSALSNPSAVYCGRMGYQYEAGEGVCVTGDGARLAAWDFYRGKVGAKYSFCARKGYDTVSEKVRQDSYYSEMPYCVNPSTKKKTPMFDLMAAEGLDVQVKDSSSAADGSIASAKVAGTFPAAFDWRSFGGHSYIGPIRDQGNCGSCYAFGAAAAAEGTYNFATGSVDASVSDYSESYIMWCLGRLPEYGSHFFGCSGADYDYKELEALTTYGIIGEPLFPYTINDPGSCTYWADSATKFSSWQRIASGDVNAMKNAIMTYGVIDVAVYAGNGFQSYSGGIYRDTKTSCLQGYYTQTNHAVALVGWGTDSVYGDYWILRNSWGPGWGENGYMRIQAKSARISCEATYLAYTTTATTTTTTTSTTTTTASTTTTMLLPSCAGTMYLQCGGLDKKTCPKAYMFSAGDSAYYGCKWVPSAKICSQGAACAP